MVVPLFTFDSDSRQINMQKCDPSKPITDPDCIGDAYFVTYEVAIVATLNDGAKTYDDSLRFYVTFGPDCREDTVMFTNTLSQQDYFISATSGAELYDHAMIQTVRNCPITCNLGQDGDLTFSDTGIRNFDAKTGTFEVKENDW